ncbi:MAG TPA: acetyl-CoA carboxylase biotin carboxyl carrier protein subunit [Gemmatimonadaceae bacterium]|nr:acetyl-CoA carboxylase biotin carboxyl carrier protein subunit [Gemmatimonadaceae bacterium]
MKYIVQVGAERLEVELDGGTAAVDGVTRPAHLTDVPGTPVRLVTLGDAVHRVIARRHPERGRYPLWVDGFRYEVEALDERTRAIRDLSAKSAAAAGPAPLKAPMPGLVVRVAVAVGDEVQAGQGLVVMEAMKMENELRSAAAGRVSRVLVEPGTAVEKGAVLVELE